MKLIHQVGNWGDTHHPAIIDLVRMVLGVLLFVKGLAFFNHIPYLRDLIMETKASDQSPGMITFIIYYVTYVHMVGGTLIFLGLGTRWAAILQLPIVFGAIFFVNILLSFVNAELWLSIMVMALLVLFIVLGSGPLSLDRLLANDKSAKAK